MSLLEILLVVVSHEMFKDTDGGCSSNSQDGPNGDGLLSIPQVTWPVWTSHDTWTGRGLQEKIKHFTLITLSSNYTN